MTTLNILKEPIYDLFFFGLIIVCRCPQTMNFKSPSGPKFNEPLYVLISVEVSYALVNYDNPF